MTRPSPWRHGELDSPATLWQKGRRMSFYASMSYDLDPETPPDARKLLRAELVGRQWRDKFDGRLTPSHTLWIKRDTKRGETTDDLHRQCAEELNEAIAAVAATGRKISLRRAWVHVSGAGTFGPVPMDSAP